MQFGDFAFGFNLFGQVFVALSFQLVLGVENPIGLVFLNGLTLFGRLGLGQLGGFQFVDPLDFFLRVAFSFDCALFFNRDNSPLFGNLTVNRCRFQRQALIVIGPRVDQPIGILHFQNLALLVGLGLGHADGGARRGFLNGQFSVA